MTSSVRESEELEFSCILLDELVEELARIKTKADTDEIYVEPRGSDDFGYFFRVYWYRPKTEEELLKDRLLAEVAEISAKQKRREQYEKLKVEFENGSDEGI